MTLDPYDLRALKEDRQDEFLPAFLDRLFADMAEVGDTPTELQVPRCIIEISEEAGEPWEEERGVPVVAGTDGVIALVGARGVMRYHIASMCLAEGE